MLADEEASAVKEEVAVDRTSNPPWDAEAIEFVEAKVRPLLEARCHECHGPDVDEPRGNLRLGARADMLKGGDTGPALVPGKPGSSLLVDAINWRGDYEMPPATKMPDGEIAILTRWVEMGAPWPETEGRAARVEKAFPLERRRAEHWAWRPVRPPTPPEVERRDWPLDPLDRFVLHRLEAERLSPAPDATRQALVRRVFFDLLGLPPTPEQVDGFLDDPAPLDQALAGLIDRLLESPHFGERWARHWLDLVRYAESRGHEFDHSSGNAYHYRDYVVRALNQDLPYDRFVVEQIAGDLLENPRLHPVEGFNESVLGTGFWYLGDWSHSPTDIRQDETDRIDNMIDSFGRAFLGLTIACARCHDHKFDAISTADYYALAGFVQSSRYRQVRFDTIEHNRRVARDLATLERDHRRRLRECLTDSIRPGIGRLAADLSAARKIIQQTAAERSEPRSDRDGKLRRLVEHLRDVRARDEDPLHAWSLACDWPEDGDRATLSERLDAAARRPRDDQASTTETGKPVRIVVDYGATTPADWSQDGFAFGDGPLRPGMLELGTTADRPLTGVVQQGRARWDPLWRGLELAPGTERDPGAPGAIDRSGRTLGTPTFTIESGVLHYLARGRAKAQAVVDSHRMIAGPLHGNLITTIASPDRPRWIRHELSRYVGHRAHVEFVPEGDDGFEILMIADCRETPPAPPPPVPLVARWAGLRLEQPAALAEAIQRRLEAVCERMSRLDDDSAWPPDDARLADWIVRHRVLFADEATTRRLSAAAEDYLRQRDELAMRIRRASRTAIAIWDGTSEDEFLLIRGRSNKPGELVPRRFLTALVGDEPLADIAPAEGDRRTCVGSGRLALARQTVDHQRNPLIARVIVNRVWHHLFGRGIVSSPDNFGVLGRPPSHPELLDHLADRFVREGWSVKSMIRTIMNSRAYRMSSRPSDDDAETRDPDNVLLHRANVRRMEAEVIRDSMLLVSGRLDAKVGGPSVPVHLTSFMTGRGRPAGGPLDGGGRRSLYTAVRRNFLSPMMLAFDMPIPSQPVGRRNVSNVPAQALILMNDPFVRQQAEIWSGSVLDDASLSTPARRIDRMYRQAFGRPASETELSAGLEFLREQARSMGIGDDRWRDDRRVWSDYAQVLWNVKEFIFIN